MGVDVQGFLAVRKTEGTHREMWDKLDDLYSRKLWHQLTVALTDIVNDPNGIKGQALIDLYNNFIVDFEHRMNQLSLVRICLVVAAQFPSANGSIEFLEALAEKVKKHQAANLLCNLKIAEYKLKVQDLEGCKSILETSKAVIDENDSIELPIQGVYFRVSAGLNKVNGNFTAFYRDALRYLGCIDIQTELNAEERLVYAFDLSLAALLSDEIYNFGELIAHPILDTLKGTDKEWLLKLVYCFNSGDINGYESLQPQWHTQSDLVTNLHKLRQKIALMTLVEIVFRRPVDNRVISFSDIAAGTKQPPGEVEFLVMRAISLNLIRGNIDQVTETVRVHWVQPRVLDRAQIANMAEKLRDWCANVENTILMAQSHDIDMVLRREE